MLKEELSLIGRTQPLFQEDLAAAEKDICSLVKSSRILVVGGAGSIGSAVVKELFARKPAALHVVDLSENNLTELVRDIRSSLGYIEGEFKSYCLDSGSIEFDAFMESQAHYDYILNFSALKHVRSEKDPFTLMRMISVNILNGEKLLSHAARQSAAKYFSVSTDKATDPVNMMGASKRIMELFMMRASRKISVSTARFANVAFSDGSLLDGFNYRLRKKQPFSAPSDVRRYFISEEEAGVLCLLAAFTGNNKELFFPKLSPQLHLISFAEIAKNYLRSLGHEPYVCSSEEEARQAITDLHLRGMWPCFFFDSDTTGEKDFEEFYSDIDAPIWDRFTDIGVLVNDDPDCEVQLDWFLSRIMELRTAKRWEKADLVQLFDEVLANFSHKETCKYLDDRM
jgi:FlaA1/EpsC-like NDP-sugar epimerase